MSALDVKFESQLIKEEEQQQQEEEVDIFDFSDQSTNDTT
jgi:hypothetical protein